MSTTEQKALALWLADRLIENAEIDAAEGGNLNVIDLELSASAELRRLSAENEALRAQSDAFERKLAELVDLVSPGLDSGDLLDDATSAGVQANALRAQVEALTRDTERQASKITELCAELEDREARHQVDRERLQTIHEHQQRECWYWQGDGEDHLESMVNSLPVVIRADQLRALTKPAYPPYETWSSNEGDSWRDSPGDFDLVDGLQVGDEYELLAGWVADRVKYRVTKAPDDTSDDYEVELVDDAATEPGFGHSDWSWPAKVIDLDADTPSPLTRPAVPEGWKLVPVKADPKMLAVFDTNDGFFIRYNKANEPAARYEVVYRETMEVVGAFATDDEADTLAARLSYEKHWANLLVAAPQPDVQFDDHPPYRECGCKACAPSFEAGFYGDPEPEAQPTEAAQKGGV